MLSQAVEHQEDCVDRIAAIQPTPGDAQGKTFQFPHVLLADTGSAAFSGQQCESLAQRTAAEAWDYVIIAHGGRPSGR
jgi:hypothetical protein